MEYGRAAAEASSVRPASPPDAGKYSVCNLMGPNGLNEVEKERLILMDKDGRCDTTRVLSCEDGTEYVCRSERVVFVARRKGCLDAEKTTFGRQIVRVHAMIMMSVKSASCDTIYVAAATAHIVMQRVPRWKRSRVLLKGDARCERGCCGRISQVRLDGSPLPRCDGTRNDF
jgi:hypothetical protein